MDKKGIFGGFFIRQDMGIDCRFMIWIDSSSKVIVLWFVWLCEDFVGSSASEKDCAQVLSVTRSMEETSESTGSSSLAQFIETDIKEMKKKIRGINRVLGRIDSEGACRFDNVYKDMAHVKKERERSIARTENVLTGMIAYLEIKFEKMELQVAKLEVANFPGSSSHHGEKAKQISIFQTQILFSCPVDVPVFSYNTFVYCL